MKVALLEPVQNTALFSVVTEVGVAVCQVSTLHFRRNTPAPHTRIEYTLRLALASTEYDRYYRLAAVGSVHVLHTTPWRVAGHYAGASLVWSVEGDALIEG